MNGYVCFYNGKRIEVKAEDPFKAKDEAVKQFKAPKGRQHTISVHLAEKYDADGNVIPVVHTPDF